MRAMKDSGVEWIGEIPQDWEVAQVRYLFNIGRGRVIAQTELVDDGIYPVYSSQTKNEGCLGYINSYDFEDEQLTWTTDGANAGTVFLRKGKHNCTNICGTLKPLSDSICLLYQKYALEHIAFYHKRADTNGYKIMNNEMATIKTLIPNIAEQQRIADYLDSKCSKIDTIIEKQQAIIEKLKEYKLSVITEAVTKGLNSDVEMKDSGIEWIGAVPKHWSVCKIKTLTDVLPGYAFASDDFVTDEGIALLRGINVTPNGVRWDDVVYWKNQYDGLKKFLLKEGDIVLGLDRPWIKEGTRVTTIKQEDLPCLLVQRVCRIRTFENADYRFILHCINSEMFKQSLSIETTGISVPHISTKQIQDFIVAIPSIEEQKSICDYLEKQIALVEKVIANKRNIINKLSEYRKSLIYEVVTGKKEV